MPSFILLTLVRNVRTCATLYRSCARKGGGMAEREPLTQSINVTEARQKWSQPLNKVFRRQTRVIVEKSGIPVAAIISAQDLERFNRLEAQRAERFKVFGEVGQAF